MSDYVVENKSVKQKEKSSVSTRSWMLPIMIVAVAAANLVLAYIY